ncbi:PTPRG [Mytilus coruscus]|uniref:protein-tyrosine-phosphatase n=1 Tax=Mytilus coruscus TaxID=42192 RepID=A0A6J8AIM4_MYTCO|nr:PTPRG [Mytilus coruscus]
MEVTEAVRELQHIPKEEWTTWLSWTSCSANCGYGTRSRIRNCQQCRSCEPLDNRDCSGLSNETEKCSVLVCTGTLFGTLTIGCDLLTTVGTFYWRKSGNRDVITDNRNKYTGLNSPNLKIQNLQYNDNGSYRCESPTYPISSTGNYTEITVHGTPQVTIFRQSHFVQIGKTATFVCNIQSNPAISELWWTDNQAQVITDTQRYSGGNKLNPNLRIISVKDSDNGVYTCNAKNTEGTSEANTTLITGNITQATILNEYYVAIKGEDLTLECLIKTEHSNKDLYWIKGSTMLRPYRMGKYSGGTLSEPSLTLKKIDKNDAAFYTCKLENEFKNSEDVVELKVLSVHVDDQVYLNIRANDTVTLQCVVTGGNSVAWRRNDQIIDTASSVRYSGDTPYIYQSSDTIQASTGDTILLKCVHESYPKPSAVFWKRDGEKLNVSVSKYNGSTINEASLTIFNTEQKDSGIYVCAVVNEIGTGYSSKILLMIKGRVSSTEPSEDETSTSFLMTSNPQTDGERNVRNMDHGSIKVNELKDYISKRHLNEVLEMNIRKCERYWPEGGKPIAYGNLVLTLLTEKERAAYITREIEVDNKKTKEKRCIIQYQKRRDFTAWPDHGTPDPLYLVLFHKHVISDHSPTEHNGPLLVHCSAGIGRTGTYIGLDALYEEGRATGFVDVVKFVQKMRYSRMNMVQTLEQYVCLHYALLEAFTMEDTNVGKKEFGTIWQEILVDKRPVNRRRLHEEFKMLKAKKFDQDKAKYVAATSPENIKKNRNESIIPTDKNRLFLSSYDKGRTDYINAVQAPSYTKFVGYLTTQLPLPETKVDFWTMVRDHNSSTIVVFLNDKAEADLVYSTSNDSFICGQFSLKITSRKKEDLEVTSCKVILSQKGDQSREIALYLAVSKGLPDPQVMCKIVNRISTRVSMSNDPVSVVSGDGAKNCGVFCTFANAVSSMTIDNNASIFQLARLLQLRRPEFFADFVRNYYYFISAFNILWER